MSHEEKVKCFVIMPFSKDFEPVWHAIQEVGVKELHFSVDRADLSTKQSTLVGNVEAHISSCNLAIIDVTGFNPNVLYEFGYSVALNKNIVPIAQEEIKTLPSDLRNYLYVPYKKDAIDDFKIDLRNRLISEVERINLQKQSVLLEGKSLIVKDTFQVDCISSRDSANLDTIFSSAKKEIKVLQTNMDTVVKKYANSIKQALAKNPELEVCFLALDPESYFAAVRANQLGKDVSEFRNDLRNALLDLYNTFDNESGVEIRVYDDFPTQICFIIDGIIYNCVVSKYQPSRNNCVFKLDDKYPAIHTSFVLHFTSVWRDTKTTRKYAPFAYKGISKSQGLDG